MTKSHILQEIKRTAAANRGLPLGSNTFAKETGIRATDWKGRFWARWGDACQEAGFAPNKLKEAYDEAELLEQYAHLALAISRLPGVHDIRLARRNRAEIAEWGTFMSRFGTKAVLVRKLQAICNDRPEFAGVVPLCSAYQPSRHDEPDVSEQTTTKGKIVGYVYLLRHGSRREYRVGCTNNALRREGEISIELPEKVQPIHVITTDDPFGIEAYWHKRFEDKRIRKGADWFELNADDIAAFKRRKFM